MLPSSGYFKNLLCPYYKSGFCCRPHCHYKHATSQPKVTYVPTPVNKVPEYRPTPISELKKRKSSETPTSLAVSKTVESSSSQPTVKIKQEPVDKGYDIVENIIKDGGCVQKPLLKKVKREPEESNAKKKLKVKDSSVNKSSSKSKTQIIAEEEELRRKKIFDRSKSDKTKEKSESTKETLKKSQKSSNDKSTAGKITSTTSSDKVSSKSPGKSNASPHKSPTKSPNRSPIKSPNYLNDLHNDLTKMLETPPEDEELVQISVAKKPRVAHKGPSELSVKISAQPKKPIKMSASQIMYNRFNSSESDKKVTESSTNDGIGKKRIAHNIQAKLSQTSSKEKTTGPTIPTKKRPVIPAEFGGKIPMALRTRYLNIFIDELLKFCPEEESYSRGLSEEKAVYTRSTSKNVYLNLAVNTVKRIRNEASAKTNGQDDDSSGNHHGKSLTGESTIGNRKVSHEMILNGPHAEGCSIEKRRPTLTVQDLSDTELYNALKRYLMTIDQLKEYGYPLRDPSDNQKAILPPGDVKKKNDFTSMRRICYRCMKTFQVDENGYPVVLESCIYHSGRLWNERFNKSIEKKYSCCKGDLTTGGCCSGKSHVVDGSFHPDFTSGYVYTPVVDLGYQGFYGIYSLDCEMCYTTVGLELTRVSVIDHKSNCVYETLVKPDHPILDYNTKFSGIKEGDLDKVEVTLKDVQKNLTSFINSKTILIGHSLESDLKALKIIHETVIDTAAIFPHRRGLPYKRALRTLMAEFMHSIIQNEVDGHDSQEDAIACMKLMLWKVSQDLTKMTKRGR